MCTEGRPVPAQAAQAAGIIDEIVEGDLRRAAIRFAKARAEAGEIRRTRGIVITPEQSAGGLEACQQTRDGPARRATTSPSWREREGREHQEHELQRLLVVDLVTEIDSELPDPIEANRHHADKEDEHERGQAAPSAVCLYRTLMSRQVKK